VDISDVKIGQRFLYKRRPWESTLYERVLLEISPNKKARQFQHPNGHVGWEPESETRWWDVVDVLAVGGRYA